MNIIRGGKNGRDVFLSLFLVGMACGNVFYEKDRRPHETGGVCAFHDQFGLVDGGSWLYSCGVVLFCAFFLFLLHSGRAAAVPPAVDGVIGVRIGVCLHRLPFACLV